MKELQAVSITVRGEIAVQYAALYKQSHDIVAIYVEFKDRPYAILATGSDDSIPVVTVGEEPDDFAEITFTDYRGWSVFAAQLSKSTLAVTLTKDEDPH